MRRVVINADDLGFTEGVNRGIAEACEAGVVTSASLLVGQPGWDDGLRRARDLGSRLRIGLHLNFLMGRPIEPVRTLVDPSSGEFLPLGRLAMRAVAGRVDPAEVAAECAAQLARLRAAGIHATHLDSHRHTHALPGFWRPVVETALREGVGVVRVPLEPMGANPARLAAGLKKAAIAAAWRVASRGAPRVRHADHFEGASLDGADPRYPARLLGILERLRPGTTEIMVHPGYGDAALSGIDGYTWQRERELEALRSPAVRERLRRGDIELTHFGAL